jgi:hypothetical protein
MQPWWGRRFRPGLPSRPYPRQDTSSWLRRANKLPGHTGRPFWQDESYDHWARNRNELDHIVGYIEENPVSARLVGSTELWLFSSAGWQAKPPAPPHSHPPSSGREM